MSKQIETKQLAINSTIVRAQTQALTIKMQNDNHGNVQSHSMPLKLDQLAPYVHPLQIFLFCFCFVWYGSWN